MPSQPNGEIAESGRHESLGLVPVCPGVLPLRMALQIVVSSQVNMREAGPARRIRRIERRATTAAAPDGRVTLPLPPR